MILGNLECIAGLQEVKRDIHRRLRLTLAPDFHAMTLCWKRRRGSRVYAQLPAAQDAMQMLCVPRARATGTD